TGGY
ncbi:hCG2039687, partial [Homo sapiens]